MTPSFALPRSELVSPNAASNISAIAESQAVLADTIDTDYPVYYLYSKTKEKCAALAEAIHPGRPEYTENASNLCSVIGVHIGPGAAGICYIRK